MDVFEEPFEHGGWAIPVVDANLVEVADLFGNARDVYCVAEIDVI